jgi:ankyrin repeat protein
MSTFIKNSLMNAASEGDIGKVAALIFEGADVNAVEEGWTPLHATMLGAHLKGGRDYPYHTACARLLLEAGADPSAKLFDRHDVMFMAVFNCFYHIILLLLERGMQIKDSCSLFDILDAWPRALFRSADVECADILKAALSEKPDVNQRRDDEDQDTPLVLASKNENYFAMRLLLGEGADPNIPDARGLTPLQVVLSKERQDFADLLIQFGAIETL